MKRGGDPGSNPGQGVKLSEFYYDTIFLIKLCGASMLSSLTRNIYKVYLGILQYMETNIRLDINIKRKLDSMKVHSRESYSDVIARVIGNMKRDIDEESLRETIEVLSDPETIRDIAEALEDYERGRFIELK